MAATRTAQSQATTDRTAIAIRLWSAGLKLWASLLPLEHRGDLLPTPK